MLRQKLINTWWKPRKAVTSLSTEGYFSLSLLTPPPASLSLQHTAAGSFVFFSVFGSTEEWFLRGLKLFTLNLAQYKGTVPWISHYSILRLEWKLNFNNKLQLRIVVIFRNSSRSRLSTPTTLHEILNYRLVYEQKHLQSVFFFNMLRCV